jgi:K+-sensing histidine kinase KdpD
MKHLSKALFMRNLSRSFQAAGIILGLTFTMGLIGRNVLGEGVIALIYLIPIGWITVRWGRLPGISAALASALCFDFFFILPLYTFTIGSIEGWLIFVFFMATSVVVVGRTKTLITDGNDREREAVILYEMATALVNLHTLDSAAAAIASYIQILYQAEFVQMNVYARGDSAPVFVGVPEEKNGHVQGWPQRTLPISNGTELIGEILIWEGTVPLSQKDDRLLQSFVHQAAVTLDHIQAEEGYARVQVLSHA